MMDKFIPFTAKIEWENGDITTERVIDENEHQYFFAKSQNNNYWCFKRMATKE